MGLALVLLVAALGIGAAFGGTLKALAHLPLRDNRLVLIVVGAQWLGDAVAWATNEHGFYPVGLAVSAIAALAFCIRNIRLAGVPLITLGLIANALVVTLNGSMPVSTSAAARANVPTVEIAAGADARHSIASHGTTLRPLGDVIAVPLPLLAEVISPGDVLIVAGVCELVLLGMAPQRRRRTSTGRNPAAVAWPLVNEEI